MNEDPSALAHAETMRKADEMIVRMAKETGARRAMSVIMREGLTKEMTAMDYATAIENAMEEICR